MSVLQQNKFNLSASEALFTVVWLLLPMVSMADIALDTNIQQQMRQQEQLKTLRNQQESKPDVRNVIDKTTSPVVGQEIPATEKPCYPMTDIKLIGDFADKFQFALDKVLEEEPILGRCLGVTGINALMARVQNVIIDKGFVTTRVLAAPQDLKTHVLQLTVVPGRINNIRLTDDSSQWVSVWNALPIDSGDILNVRDLEQGLENFKRVPTADAGIQIEPSGKSAADASQPGMSDLVIRYKQRFPLRLSVNLNDSGLSNTGKYQGSTTLSGDNLLGLNDLFYVNYSHSLENGSKGTEGYVLHYSVPWDYWLLSATASDNTFHLKTAGAYQSYVYSGRSRNVELKLSRMMYRNNINKTLLSLKSFFRSSKNYIDGTEIDVQHRRIAGLEVGFHQSWYLDKAILEYDVSYRWGTGALHSLRAPEEAFGEGTSRMKFLLADLNLMIPFDIPIPWGKQALQYNAHFRGQANFTPLTLQDRFSMGNRFTVRGFDGQQTLIADNGWLIRNDLIAPILESGQAVYWGLDYGELGGQSSVNLPGTHLAGTVIGLRGEYPSAAGHLDYDIFLGRPISKPSQFTTHHTVAGFNITYSF